MVIATIALSVVTMRTRKVLGDGEPEVLEPPVDEHPVTEHAT